MRKERFLGVFEGPLTEKFCQKALEEFRSGADDWRFIFGLPILWAAAKASEGQPVELPPSFGAMLYEVNAMLRDAHRGSKHPLGKVRKVNHRPTKNSIAVDSQIWLAAMGGVELIIGKGLQRPTEQSYRAASRRLRKHGSNVDWREVRSAWTNRSRLSEPKILEDTMQPAIDGGLTEQLLDGMASFACRYINRKADSYD